MLTCKWSRLEQFLGLENKGQWDEWNERYLQRCSLFKDWGHLPGSLCHIWIQHPTSLPRMSSWTSSEDKLFWPPVASMLLLGSLFCLYHACPPWCKCAKQLVSHFCSQVAVTRYVQMLLSGIWCIIGVHFSATYWPEMHVGVFGIVFTFMCAWRYFVK